MICEQGDHEISNLQGKCLKHFIICSPPNAGNISAEGKCADVARAPAKLGASREHQEPRLGVLPVCTGVPGAPHPHPHCRWPQRDPAVTCSQICCDSLHFNTSHVNPDRESHPAPRQHGPLYHKIRAHPEIGSNLHGSHSPCPAVNTGWRKQGRCQVFIRLAAIP